MKELKILKLEIWPYLYNPPMPTPMYLSSPLESVGPFSAEGMSLDIQGPNNDPWRVGEKAKQATLGENCLYPLNKPSTFVVVY